MFRLFRVSVPSSLVVLLVSEIALIFGCYGLATYLVFGGGIAGYLLNGFGLARIASIAAIILLVLYFNNLYDDFRVRSRVLLLQQISMALGIAFLLQAVASYGQSGILLQKWIMMWGSLMLLVLLPAWRVLFSSLIWKALGAQELVFLGLSPTALELIDWIQKHPELGLAVAGYLSDDPSPSPGVKRLGGMADLERVIEDQRPQRIVVSHTEHSGRPAPERLLQLGFAGVAVEEVASTYEAVLARVSARDLLPSQLAFSPELLPHRFSVSLQTVYSLAIGGVAFLVTLPLMVVAALAVRLTSAGPVLLREPQVGMNGFAFRAYRLRTAYQGPLAGLTPVGRWLRRLRLDELPGLLNVLRGEMALVGPRAEKPEVAAALSAIIPWYVQRHFVKPGFTGWAQINHERAGAIDDTLAQLEYDLYYVKNLAPALDAYILLYTLRKTLAIGGT